MNVLTALTALTTLSEALHGGVTLAQVIQHGRQTGRLTEEQVAVIRNQFRDNASALKAKVKRSRAKKA